MTYVEQIYKTVSYSLHFLPVTSPTSVGLFLISIRMQQQKTFHVFKRSSNTKMTSQFDFRTPFCIGVWLTLSSTRILLKIFEVFRIGRKVSFSGLKNGDLGEFPSLVCKLLKFGFQNTLLTQKPIVRCLNCDVPQSQPFPRRRWPRNKSRKKTVHTQFSQLSSGPKYAILTKFCSRGSSNSINLMLVDNGIWVRNG